MCVPLGVACIYGAVRTGIGAAIQKMSMVEVIRPMALIGWS